MLGLIAPKKNQIYTAKWISNDDRNKYGYFKFEIETDDNTYEADLNNMSGTKGDAVWKTKSGIDFQPEDIVYFRGQKFHIKTIDGNRKAEPEKEKAFAYFTNNGNLTVRLIVRKAG